jgi:hypothetical protein
MIKAAEELPAPDLQAAAPEASLPDLAGLDTEEALPSLPGIPEEGILEAEFKADEVEGFVSPPPTETVKPLGIEDDTMAWLEGLAAKQGAKPEELLTKPEDRSEEMPEWLKKTAEENPAVDTGLPASPVLPELAGGSLEQEFPEAEKKGTVPLPDLQAYFNQTAPPAPRAVTPEGQTAAPGELDGMEWLDELAEDKPVQAAGTEGNLGEELDAMPDWLRGSDQPASPVESLDELVGPVEPPVEESYTLAEPAEPPAEAGVAAPVEEDITITTWLKNLDGSNIPAEMPVTAPSSEPAEDVPDWLKDLDKRPASSAETAPAGTGLPQEDLPEWLAKPSEPAAGETSPAAPLPGSEPAEWSLEDAEPVEKPAPTVSEEWMPVSQQAAAPAPQATPQPVKREPVQGSKAVVPPPPAGQDGAIKTDQAQDKDAQTLAAAQKLLSFNNLAEAMKEYGKLIKRGRLLDEVIHDLREAQYRFPVDIIVWQTLGDAYMRANRLQDALDAYTKAEELLR